MRRPQYECSKCHSAKRTFRIYWKPNSGFYQPLGYYCMACSHLELDRVALTVTRSAKPAEEEAIILSGDRKPRRTDNLDWVNA